MEMKDIIFRIGYFRNKANLSARALSLEIDKNPAYKLSERKKQALNILLNDIHE